MLQFHSYLLDFISLYDLQINILFCAKVINKDIVVIIV